MRSRILAHRGFWTDPNEKNSLFAIERAFAQGFGIETDIRDLDGELVISHDPPRGGALSVDAVFTAYARNGSKGLLALNVKADGLAVQILDRLARHGIDTAFVLDMSVPDMRGYLAAGAKVYTRRSDVEPAPAYYERSCGVWMDSFEIPYSPSQWIERVIADGKSAALVSPELHGRAYEAAWDEWRRAFKPADEPRIAICTDFPDKAAAFFCEGR